MVEWYSVQQIQTARSKEHVNFISKEGLVTTDHTITKYFFFKNRKYIHNGLINVNATSLDDNLEGEKENQKQISLL